MEKSEKSSEEKVDKKVDKIDKNTIRNVAIFIVFFRIGIVCGYYGATKFLDLGEDVEENIPMNDDGIIDITDDDKYTEVIDSLLVVLDNDPAFYSTKGISVDTMENSLKLKLIYTNMINNGLGATEELGSLYYGSTSCLNGFITDVSENSLISTNKCTIVRLSKNAILETNKKLFNDDILDTSVDFYPKNDVKCVVDVDSYVCGNVINMSNITGNLESVFSVTKVTKNEDGTIAIYEKGYLNDKRSNVNDPYDQYDNYYLHSSDSNEYYYELKSADNLTFKHIFKTTDRQNYYYVSSELVKE
jgi:hypothetical protein